MRGNIDPTILIPNFGALLFVAWGLISIPNPLDTRRPAGKFEEKTVKDISGTVDARLWTDPFSGEILKGFESITAPNLPDLDFEGGQEIGSDKILVMPVLLPGNDYAESREQRFRSRYAVLTALGQRGFIPKYPDKIQAAMLVATSNTEVSPLASENPNKKIRVYTEFDFNSSNTKGLDFVGRVWTLPEILKDKQYKNALPLKLKVYSEFDTPKIGKDPNASVVKAWVSENSAVRRVVKDCKITGPFNVPYEIFKPRPSFRYQDSDSMSGYEKILVVWINEDYLRDETPLLSLRNILKPLIYSLKKKDVENIEIKILGPSTSDSLISFLKEPEHLEENLLEKGEILSYRATASVNILQESSGVEPHGSVFQLRNSKWALDRTIPSDDDLIHLLLDELDARGVTPCEDQQMVLVTEWDSTYSRALARNMASRLFDRDFNKKIDFKNKPTFFHEINYMRDIDGGSTSVHSKNSTSPDSQDSAEKAAAERPEGSSQLDYIRRMEREMVALDGRLRKEGKKIGSIGLAGSDVYDKLLVLRSLKRSFPEAVFFSTDLDALYSDPAELPYTRNLIIASPFDLVTEEMMQKRIPPFRDSCQSSLFFSAYHALDKAYCTVPPSQKIFEIGRNGPFELRINSTPKEDLHWRSLALDVVILLAASLFLAMLIFPFSTKVREAVGLIFPEKRGDFKFTKGGILLIFLAIILAFILIAFFAPRHALEEPFILFEGISSWPTEILRFFALILSLVFFLDTRSRLKKVQKEISRTFFLFQKEMVQKPPKAKTRPARDRFFLFSKFRSCVDRYWLYGVMSSNRMARKHQEKSVWKEYNRQTRLSACLIRVGTYTFCYFAFWVMMMVLNVCDLPFRPVRGEFTRTFDLVILIVSVLAYTFLLFSVLDITLLTNRLIKISSKMLARKTVLEAHESIQIFAKLSEEVSRFVYFPFTVLFIMILSRNSLFDNWTWPGGLIAIFGISLLFIFATAILLQRTCADAKLIALGHLNGRLTRIEVALTGTWASPVDTPDSTLKQKFTDFSGLEAYRGYLNANKGRLTVYKQTIEAVNSGGFQSLAANPIFAAILIPFGGIGSLTIFEKLISQWK